MANHNIETGRCAVLPRRFGQLWQRADELDPPYDTAFDEELWHKNELPPRYDRLTDLYAAATSAYESIMVSMLGVHFAGFSFPKHTHPYISYSRDGFHYSRPPKEYRRPFLPPSRDYVEYTGSLDAVIDPTDAKILFYIGVIRATAAEKFPPQIDPSDGVTLAFELRRDGFASLRCAGDAGAVLTRPLVWKFQGVTPTFLWVNVVLPTAEHTLRAYLFPVSSGGSPAAAKSVTLRGPLDATKVRLTWGELEGAASRADVPLESLGSDNTRDPVRFAFQLEGKGGELFSFWVSDTEQGRSRGFVFNGGGGRPYTRDV